MTLEEGLRSATRAAVDERAFWRAMTAPLPPTGEPLDLLDDLERRALCKATSGAGGYLVPTDFDVTITSLRRTGSIIGRLAREITTPHGLTVPLPTATAHGTSAWTAENAAASGPTDETFGQGSLGAFKALTSVVVSEELLDDALGAFEHYLAGELAARQVTLEETAFAVGDGSGKPLGIVHYFKRLHGCRPPQPGAPPGSSWPT